jgi:hypothetical protein
VDLAIDFPGNLAARVIKYLSLLIRRTKGNQIDLNGIALLTILAPAGRLVW